MTDQAQSEILENNPIGKGLDAFRTSFNSICEDTSISCTPDTLGQLTQEDIQTLTIGLLSALLNLPATRFLRSKTSHGTLSSDLLKLISAITSDNFHFDRIKPLLTAALTDNWDDVLIWDQVYNAYVNIVLKEKLGPMYVGLCNFHETFLGGVADLKTVSKAVFKKCREGRNPFYYKGWSGWPEDANQDDVLDWFADLYGQLAEFAGDYRPKATRRRPLRKLDIGFILIPGELKSNPSVDIASKAWLDLGRYAREVLAAQDTRRFEFDRLGGIRLIIDGLMMRKAYCEGDLQIPLIIKDFWYNIRKELDIIKAENYRPEYSIISSSASIAGIRKGRSSSTAGLKRLSSQTGTSLPPSKRSCSISPTKAVSNALPNRVYRRIILRDYGKPIYKAGSRAALLAALEGCIKGYESLRKAGFLYRDISINNLIINEDKENPSWPSFLIDLDLGIKEIRREASGARGKTGTRAFIAIRALLGKQYLFMHDLESIFWVLFWICIYYDGPNQERVILQFDKWNYVDMEELAKLKLGTVAKEAIFMKTITDNFTSYFEPLIPWVNRLWKIVFPRDRPYEQEDEGLYPRMKGILREACEDLT
ncbi:uncharacterized protein K444DRAFT_646753 [Hyaloscypha bicolor E]|uniref:Fungal-type protein kinase domain-containing protein n=1 Tax=Hyaloscypha bicolor E TaxID=1095630 RepID=A0A2J6SRF4_9HELO|nr:uncharacterized protein K444DRAFT_646753 [Hyaloscypha bicolor E]PMD53352.1 hypothetical protein K444DRAFT_646753 [Hyaloscypha bicolor E]